MRSDRARREGRVGWLVAAFALSLAPGSALACPVCFTAANEQVLYTYYLSAAFLTLMPFAIVASVGAWLARRNRRVRDGEPGALSDASAG